MELTKWRKRSKLRTKYAPQRLLIGMIGHAGSGKDTCGDYLIENYAFAKDAFARPLKDAARILFDLTDEQLYGTRKEAIDVRWGVSPREMMQFLGTEVARDAFQRLLPGIGEDFWLEHFRVRRAAALARYHAHPGSNTSNVVVCDVRFPNEAKLIKSMGGVLIRVNRPNHNQFAGAHAANKKAAHASEVQMNAIVGIDYTIENDGTLEDLYVKLRNILGRIER
jgi:hypothetical protein